LSPPSAIGESREEKIFVFLGGAVEDVGVTVPDEEDDEEVVRR